MSDKEKIEALKEWLTERLDNCERIAHSKVGAERRGWLEDAAYFRAAVASIHKLERAQCAIDDMTVRYREFCNYCHGDERVCARVLPGGCAITDYERPTND